MSVSRRTVVTGAAWSAPVIVLAAAVPAAAVSPGASLAIAPGSTASVPAMFEDEAYFDLLLTGLSITVPGPALAAGQLVLTATFTPTSPGGDADLVVYGDPGPWLISPTDGVAATVTMTYPGAVSSGAEVAVPDGDFFGTALPASSQTGTFVLTATAPGHTSATASFATGPARARGARRGVGYVRPV